MTLVRDFPCLTHLNFFLDSYDHANKLEFKSEPKKNPTVSLCNLPFTVSTE